MLFCFMACLIGSDCNSHFTWSSIRRTCTVSLEVAGPEWWVLKRLARGDSCSLSPGVFRLWGTPEARSSFDSTRPDDAGQVVSPQGRMTHLRSHNDARKSRRDASFIPYSPRNAQRFPGLGLGGSQGRPGLNKTVIMRRGTASRDTLSNSGFGCHEPSNCDP